MASGTTTAAMLKCFKCGFEAPAGDDWSEVDHPPFGTLTQCPRCASTNVQHVVS